VIAPKRSLALLTANTFANIVLGMIAQIALGIAVARTLGPAGKGTITYAGYLLIFAVSTADGLRDAISYQIGKRGLDAPHVWGAALRVIAVAGAAGCLIFLVLAWFVPFQRAAFLAAAVGFPFVVYLQTVNVLYQIFHHIERINWRNTLTVSAGAPLVTLLLLVAFGIGVPAVLGILVASYVVAAVWNSFGLSKLIGGPSRFDRADLVRDQIGFGAKAALSSTLSFLALRIDVFIVAALLSPAALGIYSLALASGEVMWVFSRSLSWAAGGRIATDAYEDAVALAARITRSSLAIHILVAIVLFIIGPALIDLVYGGRFSAAGPLLRILLPGFVLYGSDATLSYFIAARAGRPGLLLGFQSLTFVLCAALTLLGISRLGLAGAAWADTIVYVLAFSLKAGYFVRLTGVSPLALLCARPSDVPAQLRTRVSRLIGRD
jgi:O-antigen/teichoic acid export membrane protein